MGLVLFPFEAIVGDGDGGVWYVVPLDFFAQQKKARGR